MYKTGLLVPVLLNGDVCAVLKLQYDSTCARQYCFHGKFNAIVSG